MSPVPKKKFKKQYASEILRIAKGDLESAEVLSKSKSGRKENVVFLAQQAIEKALKSVLVHHQVAIPFVHDLGALVALLPDPVSPPGGFDLIQLNPYASIRRYEEGSSPLTEEEIQIVMDAAKSVIKWAVNLIGKEV